MTSHLIFPSPLKVMASELQPEQRKIEYYIHVSEI